MTPGDGTPRSRAYDPDDPLAELLEADRVAAPRPEFASALRESLMSRPPVAPEPAAPPGTVGSEPDLLVRATIGLAGIALILWLILGAPSIERTPAATPSSTAVAVTPIGTAPASGVRMPSAPASLAPSGTDGARPTATAGGSDRPTSPTATPTTVRIAVPTTRQTDVTSPTAPAPTGEAPRPTDVPPTDVPPPAPTQPVATEDLRVLPATPTAAPTGEGLPTVAPAPSGSDSQR